MRTQHQDQQYELFIRYFVAHRHQIYMFVFAQVCNKPDSEDIFQEVSTVLWRKFDQFQPGTNFLAWARQIARHLVQDYRRRHARRMTIALDEGLMEDLVQQYDHVQDDIEDRIEALRHCITKLDDPNRELIQQLYRQSQAPRQIAASCGVTVQRIYQRLGSVHEVLMRCIHRTITVPGAKV